MKVTQKNIAKLSGFTVKTVSRYFNDASKVDPETRKKIQATCEHINYMPNSAARSIREGKFRRIACILIRKLLADKREGVFLHQLQYINGMSNVLARNGYSLEIAPIIYDLSHGDERIIFPQMFSEFCVDGIICLPPGNVYKNIKERLLRFNLPAAWLNNTDPLDGWGCLIFDEYESAKILTEHLISKGKRNIVWLDHEFTGTPHYSQIQRKKGFQDTLKKAGLRSDMCVYVPSSEKPYEYSVNIFKKYPELDALISNISMFKKSFQFQCEERKRGSEFEIAYFLTEWSAKDIMRNELAMVTQETELGERAAQYVLAKIAGEDSPELLKPLIPKMQINGEYI